MLDFLHSACVHLFRELDTHCNSCFSDKSHIPEISQTQRLCLIRVSLACLVESIVSINRRQRRRWGIILTRAMWLDRELIPVTSRLQRTHVRLFRFKSPNVRP